MPRQILHFSIGSLFAMFSLVGLLGVFLLTSAVVLHSPSGKCDPGCLPTKIGPISEAITSQKMSAGEMEAAFGPLNKQALTETKEGRIMDWIRERRARRVCQHVPTSRPVVSYSRPANSRLIYTTPCVPCSPASNPVQPYQPLPSPIPSNPTVPVTPDDIVPSIPLSPAPDIQSLPVGIVPSCATGNCPIPR